MRRPILRLPVLAFALLVTGVAPAIADKATSNEPGAFALDGAARLPGGSPSPATAPAPPLAPTDDQGLVCDRLAAAPNDLFRPAGIEPVDLGDIDTDKAIAACRAAMQARPGVARYAFQLGRAFDAAKNHAAALDAYRQAIAGGYGPAACYAGMSYRDGEGVAVDNPEAFRLFKKAVELGDRRCANDVGYFLREGIAVEKNLAEAVRYFKIGAEAGSPEAQTSLGYAYEHGEGIAEDIVQARLWYEKAAAQEEPTAMNNLAFFYAEGSGGLARDLDKAVTLLLGAYRLGDETAEANLTKEWRENLEEDFRLAIERRLFEAGHLKRGPGTRFDRATFTALEAFKNAE
jgi:tetratricopeptide (TPR) repeat protein